MGLALRHPSSKLSLFKQVRDDDEKSWYVKKARFSNCLKYKQRNMYFKEIRELATLCFGLGYMSATEFAVLLDEYESCNPDFPHDEYMPFDLDDMDEIEYSIFQQHIPLLAEALRIPPYFIVEQRSRVTGIEGLCILLKRVAYPFRYSDMIHRFVVQSQC